MRKERLIKWHREGASWPNQKSTSEIVQVGSRLAGHNWNEGALYMAAYQISHKHVMCLNPVQRSAKRSRRLLKKHLVEFIELGRREGAGCLLRENRGVCKMKDHRQGCGGCYEGTGRLHSLLK